MKKRVIYVAIFLILINSFNSVISDGGPIGVGFEITDVEGPIYDLIFPANFSGDSDGNINFVYQAHDAGSVENCSLIVNNVLRSTDTSTVKDTNLNFTINGLTQGYYNWSLNCTDSLGYSTESEYFTFAVFTVDKFNGTTTNFSTVDIRDISNLVLEILPYGRIYYFDNIDLSANLNLDKYINMTKNNIIVNTSGLPVLNGSANLSLYDLTFINPRPLRGNTICPVTTCTELTYSASYVYIGNETFYSQGTFIFNVTNLGNYSSEETPEEEEPPETVYVDSGAGGGGGGGGGGGRTLNRTIVSEFEVDVKNLKVVLRQGETKRESFKVKNVGDTTLAITISLKDIMEFVYSPSTDTIEVTLEPGEEKLVNILFGTEDETEPEVYPGEIIIKSGKIEKIVNTIIEVESKEPLFDVDVEVLPQYKEIYPGESILLEVSLYNMRGYGGVDVILQYFIKDFNGNIIVTEDETVAIVTQSKFVRELLVPRGNKPGTYVAYVKVKYGDSIGTSSDVFEVKAKPIIAAPEFIRKTIEDYPFYTALAILIIALMLVMVVRYITITHRKDMQAIKKEIKESLEKKVSGQDGSPKNPFS